MAGLKEELIKATTTFDVVKILNESEPMTTAEIALALKISTNNVHQTLQRGMGKLYKDIKKQLNANPAQVMKLLMDYLNADAEDIMRMLPPDRKAEVEAYVKEHGVY